MKSTGILYVALAACLALSLLSGLLSSAIVAYAKMDKPNKMVRVLAESEDKASKAVANGCKVVRETKELKALICSTGAASSLDLPEDIRLFAVDVRANSQIGADSVQVSGIDGSGRKIVVLDTGYNYDHPDLSSSYLGGKDFVNNDNDPNDDNGHGSHVAGLITADGIDPAHPGAKGAARGAGIIAGKVLDSSGSGFFSDIVAAIYWAVDGPDGVYGTSDDFGADAINLSLGTSAPFTYKGFCNGVVPSMSNAIKYAKDRGTVVVVAAGNSGSAGVSIPGCISYSTTVGAVNRYDTIASFSGRGSAVDIVAPGVGLVSTGLDTSYVSGTGTSMATPIVSATVALIKHNNPSYSSWQVELRLFNNAVDLGEAEKDTSYGNGRVNAYDSVYS